jgi:hypothetical protein
VRRRVRVLILSPFSVRFLPRAAFGPRGTDARLDLTGEKLGDKDGYCSIVRRTRFALAISILAGEGELSNGLAVRQRNWKSFLESPCGRRRGPLYFPCHSFVAEVYPNSDY